MKIEKNIPYAEKIYESIKRAIVVNEFKQEQVLDERNLSKQLNVSRTPLRDGLILLEKEGWIVKCGKSRIVSVLTWKDIQEIFDIRVLNEGYAVKRVAETATPAMLQLLKEKLEATKQNYSVAQDKISFLEADLEFHHTLAHMCGNARLETLLQNLEEQFVRISFITVKNDSVRIFRAIDEHYDIYQAIAEGNGLAAAKACEDHITLWFNSLKNNWEDKQ